jgi:DNA-binding transcriptional LysR family regulator
MPSNKLQLSQDFIVDPELSQLFLAIVQSGNIAAGAKTLGISPSYASRKILLLEKLVNARLFTRTTRALMLTKAGEAYLTYARDVSERGDQLRDELAALQDEPTGLVRLACQIYSGHNYLKSSIARFRESYPDIRFQVKVCDHPAEQIALGFDLAIDSGPMPPGNFIGRKIQEYHRVLCASPKLLEKHFVPKTLKDLERLPCLSNSLSRPNLWHFVDDEGRRVSYSNNPIIEINSLSLLRELAIQGAGVIFIGEHIVRDDIAAKRLVRVLPNHIGTDAKGENFTIRLIFPERQIPLRAKLFAQHLEEDVQRTNASSSGASRRRG